MSDEEVFKEQLRQEQIAKENDDVNSDRTRVDPDGTVYEYDIAKKAWFPKIDADFIARYQMNYGTDVGSADATTESTAETAGTPFTTMDPSSSAYYYNYYAKSGSADTATTDSRSYQEWYDYYYGKYASETTEAKGDASDTTSETSIPPPPSDINSQEYYDWYYMYYGATKSNSNKDSTSTIQHDDEQSSEHHDSGKSESPPGKNQKGDSKQQIADILAAKRKAAEPPSWFEVTQDKNTNVYVSGLPLDMTDDDFKELMNKCGLIMFDPLTKKAKLKLYKDENGQNKGDGRCCYIKPESVELALQILDGSEIKGHKIYVERARFELKGAFDPSKRRRKLTKQEKKKFKLKQEKLFDWRPDKPLGTRNRWERIVILKNVFDPKIIEASIMRQL
ncbi:hypothetical protein LSH36_355g01035 [Paralvinella palmiformis]|uniref:RRM domain-containing protein n=1 Tax=Paralvinella palmiformis TaxID=53620 RepID=A0AAD9N169_9ANNE|nr:hypothetical protein LSH36_355g01035 [Paralvinella palmiformis]